MRRARPLAELSCLIILRKDSALLSRAATFKERTIDSAQIDRSLNAPLFTISRTPVTLATLLLFLGIVLATIWISSLAERGARRAFALRGVKDPGTVGVATRLIHYAVLLLGLGIGLQTIGVDLGALVAAGAFFAVALGFAMQNIAQNFLSGIILLTERTIKPGDVLEVEGRVVRVSRMGLRATVARTRDEEDLMIPNATLVQNTVTNYTLRDPIYRLRTSVGVSYNSDMRQVSQVLRDAALTLPQRMEDRDPRVLLTEFGDSSVNFEVSVWSRDPWAARITRSALNEAIWWALRDAKITIPFPQRDVHIVQEPVPDVAGPDQPVSRSPA
ncbi:MAG: mechanosensitive ion channel [Gemmatimonadales bacterium]|nr:mechanosensitive ion channel [Gemmatimonadales bacterium]